MATPGVEGVHEVRTRKMGDFAVVDVHIENDPKITVVTRTISVWMPGVG